jgi:hypothetical protein
MSAPTVRPSKSCVDRAIHGYAGCVTRCPVIWVMLSSVLMIGAAVCGILIEPIDTGSFSDPTAGFIARGTDMSMAYDTFYRIREYYGRDNHEKVFTKVFPSAAPMRTPAQRRLQRAQEQGGERDDERGEERRPSSLPLTYTEPPPIPHRGRWRWPYHSPGAFPWP